MLQFFEFRLGDHEQLSAGLGDAVGVLGVVGIEHQLAQGQADALIEAAVGEHAAIGGEGQLDQGFRLATARTAPGQARQIL